MKDDSRHPFQKFSDAVRKVMQTPKAEVEAREKVWREERAAKKKRRVKA